MNDWFYLKDLLPKEGVRLECTTPSGDVVELVRRGRLFFSGNMYVYFTPVKWRYIT